MKIELGAKVKCDITGFTGIVTCKAEYLFGEVRWDVHPPIDKDGKLMDSAIFDNSQLTVLEKSEKTYKIASQEVVLGQKIIDPISDIEGIAIGKATYLNGCCRILLAPKKNKDGKAKSVWFDEPQLKIIQVKPEIKQGDKTTGGPCPMVPNRDY